jgi:hypothetical protein
MKLVMTLLARDEADIVDANIAFHLSAGVDFVIATDNASEDGTTEILERYERAGCLHLIRESADEMRQSEWVTRMARLAATDFGADWVVNADADEFWWPQGGSLKEVLAAVPERFGIVRGCWRHFLPRPDHDSFFAERMTVRLRQPAFPGAKETIFHAHQKVAHRADPNVTVESGNHDAYGVGLAPLRGWHPIEVLHFSFRSEEQIRRKAQGAWLRSPTSFSPTQHQFLLDAAVREGRAQEYFDSFAVTDEALGRGVADGTLAVDTRLRDALRTLRGEEGELAIVADALRFPRPEMDDDAAYAAETAVLVEVDGLVRAERRVDAFETRLTAVEHGRALRPRSRGRRTRGAP